MSTPTPRQSHVPQSAKPGHSTSFHFRAELNPNPPRPNPLHLPIPARSAHPNPPTNCPAPRQTPPIPPPSPPSQAPPITPRQKTPPHNPPPPFKTRPTKPPTHSKHKAKPIDFQSTYLYIMTSNIIPSLLSLPHSSHPPHLSHFTTNPSRAHDPANSQQRWPESKSGSTGLGQ